MEWLTSTEWRILYACLAAGQVAGIVDENLNYNHGMFNLAADFQRQYGVRWWGLHINSDDEPWGRQKRAIEPRNRISCRHVDLAVQGSVPPPDLGQHLETAIQWTEDNEYDTIAEPLYALRRKMQEDLKAFAEMAGGSVPKEMKEHLARAEAEKARVVEQLVSLTEEGN